MSRDEAKFAISDLQFAIDERSDRKSQIANRKWDRLGRYVASRGWLHLTLLVGVGIFIFPFVWMVATSLKTDEELTGTPGGRRFRRFAIIRRMCCRRRRW